MSEDKIEVQNNESEQTESTRTEEFTVTGEQVFDKVKELLREGNVRRLSINTQAGKTIFEIPLTFGVAGTAALVIIAPMLTAVLAIVAVATKLRISVERVEETA